MTTSCSLPGIQAALRVTCLYCPILHWNQAANLLLLINRFSQYFKVLNDKRTFSRVQLCLLNTLTSLNSRLQLAVIELPEWMGLAGLPWFFTAVQMHLHWGSGGPSHGGSEHTINGLSADAEVHLNTGEKGGVHNRSRPSRNANFRCVRWHTHNSGFGSRTANTKGRARWETQLCSDVVAEVITWHGCRGSRGNSHLYSHHVWFDKRRYST